MHALNRLGVENQWTDDPELIRSSDKVIIPGVGEAGTAMSYLKERGLDQLVKSLEQPVLGICLGLQIMCSHSEEKDTDCLGIFPERVKQFPGPSKVPHIGWNTVQNSDGVLFGDSPNDSFFYFVHSFYAQIGESTISECEYDIPFSAAMKRDNFWATQFHPEKSAHDGSALLERWVSL